MGEIMTTPYSRASLNQKAWFKYEEFVKGKSDVTKSEGCNLAQSQDQIGFENQKISVTYRPFA